MLSCLFPSLFLLYNITEVICLMNRMFDKVYLTVGYIEQSNKTGKRALHEAVQYSNYETVSLLLEHGNPERDTDRQTERD